MRLLPSLASTHGTDGPAEKLTKGGQGMCDGSLLTGHPVIVPVEP